MKISKARILLLFSCAQLFLQCHCTKNGAAEETQLIQVDSSQPAGAAENSQLLQPDDPLLTQKRDPLLAALGDQDTTVEQVNAAFDATIRRAFGRAFVPQKHITITLGMFLDFKCPSDEGKGFSLKTELDKLVQTTSDNFAAQGAAPFFAAARQLLFGAACYDRGALLTHDEATGEMRYNGALLGVALERVAQLARTQPVDADFDKQLAAFRQQADEHADVFVRYVQLRIRPQPALIAEAVTAFVGLSATESAKEHALMTLQFAMNMDESSADERKRLFAGFVELLFAREAQLGADWLNDFYSSFLVTAQPYFQDDVIIGLMRRFLARRAGERADFAAYQPFLGALLRDKPQAFMVASPEETATDPVKTALLSLVLVSGVEDAKIPQDLRPNAFESRKMLFGAPAGFLALLSRLGPLFSELGGNTSEEKMTGKSLKECYEKIYYLAGFAYSTAKEDAAAALAKTNEDLESMFYDYVEKNSRVILDKNGAKVETAVDKLFPELNNKSLLGNKSARAQSTDQGTDKAKSSSRRREEADEAQAKWRKDFEEAQAKWSKEIEEAQAERDQEPEKAKASVKKPANEVEESSNGISGWVTGCLIVGGVLSAALVAFLVVSKMRK